jgi:dihydrofolate reductase
MGELHVHEFVSLDGVIDAPSWTFPYEWDPQMGSRLAAVTGASQGILLGRTTFEMFAPAWSTRTVEEDPGAPFFNNTTKYVVSSTLTDAESTWRNSEAIGRYDPDTIRKLKDDVGNLYLSGSGTLLHALLRDGLVDQLHLCVYPHARGAGPRLFPDSVPPSDFERVIADVYENGVLYLSYRPAT